MLTLVRGWAGSVAADRAAELLGKVHTALLHPPMCTRCLAQYCARASQPTRMPFFARSCRSPARTQSSTAPRALLRDTVHWLAPPHTLKADPDTAG
eukprot:1846923-Rhodomonas_salina.1